MTNLGRFWLSVGAGVAFSAGGALLVAIFGPLLFPLSLNDSDHPEDSVVRLLLATFLCCGICGFFLGWKLLRRCVENSHDPAVVNLDLRER